jgi:hypothetical protein
MGEHKLLEGAQLIEGLEALGRVLGYHVSKEFPVSDAAVGLAQAVDVAWFADAAQPYPLMIFEVESGSGNTIANNPLKVFAQDNRQFEKPLFYFHLLVSGGQRTPRVAQLERQYGTYNYRLYRLAHDQGTALVKDIVEQHGRVSRELDYVRLYEALQSAKWVGLVDAWAVIDHAYRLGLRRERLLPSLIHLARRYDEVVARLPALIEAERASGWASSSELPSWLGQTWGPMILSAWMCGRAETTAEALAWEKHLLRWQNKTSSIPMFNSELALSRDHAEFMLSLGGPFAALVVALGKARGTFGQQLCAVLLKTLYQLRTDWHGLQLAAWALHLSARLGLVGEYEAARTYVDAAGGLTAEDMLTPPSSVDIDGSTREGEFQPWDGADCCTRQEFLLSARRTHAGQTPNRVQLMLAVLDEEQYWVRWNCAVLAALWEDAPGG